jgi:N-acyl-D-amino-acid deacylase
MARHDLIIRSALLYDGSGAAPWRGDLAIEGSRIAALGDLGGASAEREIDADGLALAPGFIDVHTHDDRAVLEGAEGMRAKLSQGVTTVIVGNCGISLAPEPLTAPPPPLDLLGDAYRFEGFAAYAEALEKAGVAVNVAGLVGHTALRVAAMAGEVDRPARDAEIARMQRRLAQALAEGALGLSSGLYYPPAAAAPTEEVIALAEPLRAAGGLYVTHLRDEADHVIAAIEEALGIGRAVGAGVVISHHKCALPENFGRSAETLPLLERAAARQDVAFDVYPYAAASTVLLPERVRPDVPVLITWSRPHPECAGRALADIARAWGISLGEAAARLLPAGAIYFQMDEADVRRILAHPLSMIGSDGLPHDQFPHPRLWGTFPRVLGHYARELGLFSMEAAIHKMTGRPAAVFGLARRGLLREGFAADLVLFDPARVIDRATFTEPLRPAEGIAEVFVNGVSVWREGAGVSGARPGEVLRRA